MVLKEAIPEKKKLEAQRRQGSTRVTQQVSTRCRPEPWSSEGIGMGRQGRTVREGWPQLRSCRERRSPFTHREGAELDAHGTVLLAQACKVALQ